MSDDFASNSLKEKIEKSKTVKKQPSSKLSEYGERLEGHVKTRYLEKIAVIGIDLALLVGAKLDPECLPPIEIADVFSYLILTTSYYTLKQFGNIRSLQAYNQMLSGFIMSVQGKIFGDKFLVTGKVRHSQRMNESPIPVWIITDKDGAVISAHCLGCKAGLGESCSHVASVLFYVETSIRINGKLACTQVKCSWLLPTYVNEVNYEPVKNINFKSAKRLKDELDKKIDEQAGDCHSNTSSECSSLNSSSTSSSTRITGAPTDKEMETFFSRLNETKMKPAILSLIPP